MKLVQVASWVTFLFWVFITILVCAFLGSIVDSSTLNEFAPRGRGEIDFFDNGFQNYFERKEFQETTLVSSEGPKGLLYFLVILVGFLLAVVYSIPPYLRAKNIESGNSNSKALIYVWAMLHLLTGFVISGVIMLIGAMTDNSEAHNSERSYYDERVYHRRDNYRNHNEYDAPYNYQRSNNLHERVRELEDDIKDINRKQRKSRYDIDDEFEYMNRRNNRKFQDIEEDIEDLHDEVGRRRR